MLGAPDLGHEACSPTAAETRSRRSSFSREGVRRDDPRTPAADATARMSAHSTRRRTAATPSPAVANWTFRRGSNAPTACRSTAPPPFVQHGSPTALTLGHSSGDNIPSSREHAVRVRSAHLVRLPDLGRRALVPRHDHPGVPQRAAAAGLSERRSERVLHVDRVRQVDQVWTVQAQARSNGLWGGPVDPRRPASRGS